MSKLRPAFRLHLGPERKIFDALEVNNLSKRMTRTPGTLKRISLSRIILLMHHPVGANPHQHSQKKTKTIVLIEKNPNNKAKAKILLPLASTPPLSERTKTRIRTKKTYPTLSATLVSRKVIIPTSILKKSQKTSVCLNNLHVGD